jgi:hypothetical protein
MTYEQALALRSRTREVREPIDAVHEAPLRDHGRDERRDPSCSTTATTYEAGEGSRL